MEKVFFLKGLDCPHCAAEIEKAVHELECIQRAQVNLMKQSLTVEIDSDSDPLPLIQEIVHSHEPDVVVLAYQSESVSAGKQPDSEDRQTKHMILRLIAGAVLFAVALLAGLWFSAVPTVALLLLIGAYLVLGWDVVLQAVRNIIKGRVFDENFLMALATVGAFAIGEYHEAVAVMLFYQVGEFFQTLSVKRSRKSIVELMDLRPDHATALRDGVPFTVAPDTVAVGEHILVLPGERIPLDGIVVEGESMLDTSALTGESVPRRICPGDEVLSGCINQSGVLSVRVTKTFGDSTAAKVIDLVENAASRKAPAENFITTFARWYTPAVVILAALLAVVPPLVLSGGWGQWFQRGLVFLVVSCPCALVISIPLTFFSGIGAASRHGVLVKGSNYLEALDSVSTVVFDKTGTLTKGVFQVTDILPGNGFTGEEVLAYAAQAEQFSNHPIAKSILLAYKEDPNPDGVADYREISGRGISVTVRGKKLVAGSAVLLGGEGIKCPPCSKLGTKVYVAVEGVYAGCIVISDEVKADSKQTIAALKDMGVEKTVMLTGDEDSIAGVVAKELGIDEYHARLLPDEKVARVELLESRQAPGKKLAFVGDGINDAPVLARADVGIAMGALGSDAAIEAADVVLMTDEPGRLLDAIRVAKATKRIVVQNIVLALSLKGIILILGALGKAGMWAAVFADVGVAMLAVLNAMRMLKK